MPANDGVFYTVRLNIKRIQAEEKFIDESFNVVIDDLDQKLLGIDHLNSGMHWTPWESGTSYMAGDVIRWPRLKSHQYAKCIQGGTSGANAPVVNTTGAEVSSGSTRWKIMSLTEVSDVKGGAISIWLGGGTLYERGDAVIYGKSIYRCKTASHYSSLSFQADIANWQEVFASIRFWQPNTYYDVDDTVIVDGFIHICLASHTSQSTYNLAEKNNWKRMHDYAIIPEWEPSTRYLVNQVVTIDGILYICTYDHTSDSSDVDVDEAYWTPLYASLQDWTTGSFYGVGATILYDNFIYKCTTAHVASQNFATDINNWALLHQLPSKLYDWDANIKYDQYQLVYYGDNIYRALYAHTSGANFDPTKWQIVSDSINDWVSQGDYQVGQYVNYQRVLYKCIVDNNDTNFTPAKWQKVSGGGIDSWITNKAYSVGDVVINANKIYQCNTAHTSTSFNTDVSNWTEISACITRIPNWAVSTEYVVGDLVAHDAKIYRCITAHTSDATQWDSAEEANWEELSPTINEISNWAVSTDYAVGQLVIHDNKLYRCNTAHTSDSTSFNTDITYWDVIGSSGIDSWKTGELYQQGSMIVYNDKIYVCDSSHTSANPFDYTKWHEVSSTTIEDWQANTEYVENQLIEYNDTLFRANKDFTSGTAVSDDDNNLDFVYANLSTWKSGVYYRQGVIVIDSDDKIYKCKQSHTSSSANRDTNWEELSKTLVEEYAQNKNYAEGAPVLYNGKLYRANTDVTNSTATLDPNKWDNIVGSGIEQWQPSTNYSVGNVVVNNDQIYICKTAHTSDSSDFNTDVAKWDVLDTKWQAKDWVTNIYYLENEVVLYDNTLYRCITAHTSLGTFELDKADWEPLSANIRQWVSGTTYKAGDIVIYNGDIWKCVTSNNSVSFEKDKWRQVNKCNIEMWRGAPDSNILALLHFDDVNDLYHNEYGSSFTSTISKFAQTSALFSGCNYSLDVGGHGEMSSPTYYFTTGNEVYTLEYWFRNEVHWGMFNQRILMPFFDGYSALSMTSSLCVINDPQGNQIGTFNEGQIIHIAQVITGTESTVYLNGVSLGTITRQTANASVNVHIADAVDYYKATLDELRISNIARYTSNFTPKKEIFPNPNYDGYKYNDLVVYEDKIYRAEVNNNDVVFTPSHWVEVSKSEVYLDWGSNNGYTVNDTVIYQNQLYRCITNHTSTNDFNDDYDKWIPLDKNCFVYDWAVAIPYYVGEVVKYDDGLFRCKTSHVSTLSDKPVEAILYAATGNTIDVDDTTIIPYSETIDLGSVKKVTDIDYIESTIDMSFTYTIEVSDDNVNYVNWVGVSIDARYIKLTVDSVNIVSGATSPNAHLTDFTVYGDSNNWEKISSGGADIDYATDADIDNMFS